MSTAAAPMSDRARILVVEDEPRISTFLVRGLAAEGFEPTPTASGDEAVRLIAALDPSLVLMDLGLPDISGLEALQRISRARPDIPVMVLSARGDLPTRLAGLRAGARDYLTKPFSFEELLARIRIHLRAGEPELVHAGGLAYDPRTREVNMGGRPVRLSDRESRVLECLLRSRGEVVSRERLLSSVWGYSFRPDTNVVDVSIKRLRGKLGNDYVETVRGVGYRFSR